MWRTLTALCLVAAGAATVGRYVSTVTNAGDTVRANGRYVTIWRRQPDGSLKVVMDLGNPVD